MYRGPVILSWKAIQEQSREPERCGNNVTLQEFAHQLDFLDQSTDGTPPLPNAEMASWWHKVMTTEYESQRARIDRAEPIFFSEQAAESPTEFFADITEAFIVSPVI
jgi:hypothetical protein